MSNRFVAKLLPNSTLVQGVFDTHKNEFMMNPKYPAHNPKSYTFTNLTNLHRVVAEANKAHVEETKRATEAAKAVQARKVTEGKAKGKKAKPAEPVKEPTLAEKRAAGLVKARQARAAKIAERKAQEQVAA